MAAITPTVAVLRIIVRITLYLGIQPRRALISERIGRLVAIPDDASQAYGENRERLDALAAAPMKHESLDKADAHRVAEVTRQSRDADS